MLNRLYAISNIFLFGFETPTSPEIIISEKYFSIPVFAIFSLCCSPSPFDIMFLETPSKNS